MTEPEILFVYKPREGEFVTGVPQRDLTADDVVFAGPDAMRIAAGSGLYVAKATKPKPETKKEKAEREAAEAKAFEDAAAAERERLAAIDQEAQVEANTLGVAPSDGDGGDDSGNAGEGNGD